MSTQAMSDQSQIKVQIQQGTTTKSGLSSHSTCFIGLGGLVIGGFNDGILVSTYCQTVVIVNRGAAGTTSMCCELIFY